MAKRSGLSDAQIQALSTYEHSEVFDAKSKVTLRYSDHVTHGGNADDRELLGELQQFYRDEEVVELTLVICTANFTNRFNNALGHEPDLG